MPLLNNAMGTLGSSRQRKDCILIVDDDPLLLEITSTFLSVQGWKVVMASSGAEAIEKLERRADIGVIVMDVLMPGMTGFETATQIKKHGAWRNIPILFLSATKNDQQWFDIGAVMFMSKPIDRQQLLNNVAIFQGYYQQEQDIIALHEQMLQKQEEVDHLQRLESIGTLASGIAHDFNNLLVGISGNADLIKLDHPTMDLEPVNHILDIVLQGRRLCQSLMGYAGNQGPMRGTFVLADVIKGMSVLLGSASKSGVNIHYDTDGERKLIDGDRAQIEQLLMNLVINASESMDGRSDVPDRVDVVTRAVQMHDGDFAGCVFDPYAPPQAGEYIHLLVRDNGCGMPEDVLQRIFEPFYTTKETGNGLGLSATLGIVQSHGGALRVDSEVGVGTTFHMYFPTCGTAAFEEAVQLADTELTGANVTVSYGSDHAHDELAGKTVLVIDDNASIRNIVRGFLSKRDMACLQAENGQQGLDVYAKHQDEIDAVILDMTMPVMDGHACSQALFAMNPAVKIIVSTGFAASRFTEEESMRFAGFLPKPYTASEFYQVLHEVLDDGMLQDQLFGDEDAEILDDNDDLLQELLPDFLTLVEQQIDTMRSAMEKGDYAAVKAEAHDLKGACGTFGFFELSEVAKRLDKAALVAAAETGDLVQAFAVLFERIKAEREEI